MENIHSLLKRQLTRHFGDHFSIPEEWRGIIQAVNEAYREFDADRGMLERSLELSSQELLQANSEMVAIFQAIPDLLFRLDNSGTILEYAAGNISEFVKDPDELLGTRIQEVPSREVSEIFDQAINQVRLTKSMAVVEYCLYRHDRKQCYEARLLPLLQDQMIAIIRNITEHKESEDRLRESERHLDSIIQGSPIPAFVISKDHRVIYWNRALEELTGLKGCELIGTDRQWTAFYTAQRPCMADLLVDQDFESISKWYKNYGRSRLLEEAIEATGFFPILGKDGRWLHFTTAAIRDSRGELVGAIETFEDITERKKAEEALAEAEEKYRSIFENAVNGIFQISIEGRLISVNPAFADTLGYDSPAEVLETIADFGSQVFVKPQHYSELLHQLDERGIVREFEAQFRRKDEKIAWITLNARAVRDVAGRIVYIEGTAQDITERKMFESRLFQRQKMDAIGTLAGGIAHDFNNLLAPVIGYTELALSKVSPENRLRGNLEQVLKSAHRAKDLVSQILSFSRQSEQERKPIQLGLVVKETLGLIRSSLPSTIEIQQNVAPGAGSSRVTADSTQMHQVIMNLCANAGHAMREKGGVLEVSLSNEEIDPIATRLHKGLDPGSYLRLSVRDTGHGMEHDILKRIFDPYFTTKDPGEGTGLGLAVVYSIVKNHKGVITAYSEPGRGSAFHVYLPRVDTGTAAPVVDHAPPRTGTGRILVVDDDEALVELELQMLEELGYEVTARHSSTEALETFRADPDRFDLIFTDQTMPGMTGLELARQVLQIRPGMPIILCTGYSDIVASKDRHIGISTILPKPLLLNQVADAVQRVLCGDS